jgi:hypothetical protein
VDRVEQLRRTFRDAERVSQCIPAIWPSLALVSCWADGPSLVHANNLRQYLSGIEIQPKGLLATEAFVTVPLVSLAAPALAIRSHFFEFQPARVGAVSDDLQPLLADELVEGEHYRVIVTTEGGIYRYQLHDVVEVAGFHGEAPLLRFIGKTDDISDLVGEKLAAAHVEAVLQAAFREWRLLPTFAQLRAVQSSPPGYLLQLVAPGLYENPPIRAQLCQSVENGLGTNPGYRYARAMGQLRPLEIELLDPRQAEAITSRRISDRVVAGQRLGDIKPVSLYD